MSVVCVSFDAACFLIFLKPRSYQFGCQTVCVQKGEMRFTVVSL